MMGERREIKVIPLVEAFVRQVTSAANDNTANCWSAVRYNANNAWYVNTSNGNVTNTNTYNRYALLPCPLSGVDLLFSMMLEAEASCYRNKHDSLEACRVHYHLSELYRYARRIYGQGLSVGRSKCFVLDYPVYREVFCAQYFDRTMHHMVAPMMTHVAEVMHRKSGNVSHGNRTGHSAFTAALAVQDKLRKATEGWTKKAWVATRDYSGFFMSIPRKKAADMFREYAVRAVDSEDATMAYLIDIACLYLMAEPTKDCIRLSPMSKWKKVASNKSLFTSKPEHGLPIGNFPSQLMANLYRTGIDTAVSRMEDVEHVVFVDDRMTCARSREALKAALKSTEEISKKFGLTTNRKKRYMQQADKGVKFCGYVIKCDRIYISNRVVRASDYLVDAYAGKAESDEEAELARSINSYFGLMAHTRSYNIQKRIAEKILQHHKTLLFEKRGSQLVCRQKKQCTPLYQSIQLIKQFKKYANSLSTRTCHRRTRRHAHRALAQK